MRVQSESVRAVIAALADVLALLAGVRVASPAMTVQLNQIIAVGKGVKSRATSEFTAAYQLVQKPAPFSGLSRTYKPIADDGEQFPPESTLLQTRAADVLANVEAVLTRVFDVELTKDAGNSEAKADVVIDGVTIAAAVPVTYLLFLEKQLVDVATFVGKLPVLDPSDTWEYDTKVDAWATPPAQTTKSKKVPRAFVKAEATPQHAAQVEVWHEDQLVGYWTAVKYSGALPQKRVNELKARVSALADAVKSARELANTTIVADRTIGAAIFGYLLAA